ncbi:MAG: hypothetical protein PHQ60_03170 [Sideroxydans sp.]|nr:hypothetical protein [Sideroxydans sp.]
MAIHLKEVLAALTHERRAKVEQRAEELAMRTGKKDAMKLEVISQKD